MQNTIKTRSGRTLILPTPKEEAEINAGIAADSDTSEWSDEDFKNAMPFSALPASMQAVLRGRGKQKTPTKVSTTVRFDPEVLEAFRATGRGWQTRMNDVLRDWLREHAA
jgi:uncharacterized protein (DUF4415 family)